MRDRSELSAAADPAELATMILAGPQGGLLLAKVERDVRPLATAPDVTISLIASLAPAAPDRRGTEPRLLPYLASRQPAFRGENQGRPAGDAGWADHSQ